MSMLKYFNIFCLIFILDLSKGEPIKKITVVISRADPLIPSGIGISMKIIETFAKKIKHKVEYLVINETLGDVFDTDESFEQFARIHSTSGKPLVK